MIKTNIMSTKNRALLYVVIYIIGFILVINIAVYMMTYIDTYSTGFAECYVSDITEDDTSITYHIVKLADDDNKELVDLQLNKKDTLNKDIMLEKQELSKVSIGDYFVCTVKNHYTYKKIFGFDIENNTSYITKLGIYEYPALQMPELYNLINE